VIVLLALTFAPMAGAQTEYDFLIKGGRVIDGRNGISAVRDVAIKDRRIAAVAPDIPAARRPGG
jgi:dihydroorotase